MNLAQQAGRTKRDNHYAIIQDSPVSFHLSITVGDVTQHDHVTSPASIDTLHLRIMEMETELLDSVEKLPLSNN